MNTFIDPDFSVYDLISRSRQASIILSKRREMIEMSYRIEERIADQKLDGVMFAAFQYLSRFEARQDAYARLAQNCDHVYIFAYPDVPIPQIDNLTVVTLNETDKLMEDWFVIFHGADYYSALVAREDIADDGDERVFQSLWTFDLAIIQIITDWLHSLLDAPARERTYNHDRHGDIMDEALDDYIELSDRNRNG